MNNTPERFAGQFVMVDIPGTALDSGTAAFLRESAIRAVCLFRHNLGSEDEIRALTAALKEILGPAGLIAIDQEGGSVIRATSVPQAPAAMALGAIDDADFAHAVGAAVARGLAHLGINWNFAPVLDVNNNPNNAVIGARSFGADPKRVAVLAQAWLRGSLSAGVACCVKHFPGHGDTHVDSHLDLPRVDKSRATLEACELLPFQALSAEAPAIMSAHIVYAAWDKEHPATLAPTLLTGLLRDAWQYQGVVITDALNMGAIRDFCGKDSYGEVAVTALSAGADMVMALGDRADQQRTLAAISAALGTGKLDAARLAASRERLSVLAQRYPLQTVPYPTELRTADQALMDKVWRLALTCTADAVPPAPTEHLRVVFAASAASDGVSDPGLDDDQVRALFAGHRDQGNICFCPIENLDQLVWDSLPEPQTYTVLVSTSRSRYSETAKDWKPDLHLVLWNPFQVLDVAAPALISWGFADGARRAVAAWLSGKTDALGRSPVPL